MKALALVPGTTKLQLVDQPVPTIHKESELKVKVLRVGICGTDREEAAGGRAEAPPGEKQLIIGHEMVGRVVEIGKKVSVVKPGDLVVITVRRGCGGCAACAIARSDMCTTGNYRERGIKGLHGFQSEYIVDDEAYAIRVPQEIEKIAVLAEPMSVVQKAVEEASTIQTARMPYLKGSANWLDGKAAIVAGLGPIGLLAALVLRLRGAKVFGLDIVDPTSPRVKILTAIGGTYLNGKEKMPDMAANLIFDAAGIAKLDFDLLEMLAINGAFVLTGVPGEQRLIDVDGAALMRKLVLKNQVMVGSVNESIDHLESGIRDLQAASKKWPGVVEKLITQRFAV